MCGRRWKPWRKSRARTSGWSVRFARGGRNVRSPVTFGLVRTMNRQTKWFGPRQSGAGLPDPICWQGVVVYVVALLLLIGGSVPIGMREPVWLFVHIPVVLALFAIVCRIKGPPFREWFESVGPYNPDAFGSLREAARKGSKRTNASAISENNEDEAEQGH